MELMPVTQLDRKSMRFLLDQSVVSTKGKKLAPNFLTVHDILHATAKDWIILNVAKKQNLTVVTRDKKMIVQAIVKRQDIVFVDDFGRWHFVRGSETETLGKYW